MKNYFLVVVGSLLLMANLCSLSPVYGQQASRYVPNQIPASPEAASLGKFVEIPVNLYQGLPQISIPIYEFKVGSLSVPVSLKYHASGFRMSETSSSVGAGWVLEAGGTLSRTLRGRDDEGNNGYTHSNNARWFFTESGYPKLENTTNTSSISYGGVTWAQTNAGATMCALMENQQKGDFDTEPDLYTFSAPGLSGKFVYDLNGQVHFVPHQNTEISSDNGAAQSKNWFGLESAQGIRYTFGSAGGYLTGYVERNSSSIYNAQIGSPQNPEYVYNSAWHLSQITSQNSMESVSFEYEVETTETISITNQSWALAITNGGVLAGTGFLDFQENKTKTVTNGGRLKKIISSEGVEITFLYESAERKDLKGGHRLEWIEIRKHGVLLKKYKLSHDYFGDISSYDSCYLRLDQVREYPAEGDPLPPYVLSYSGNYAPQHFPTPIGRNSYAQDEWGFYNAQNINRTDFIPAFKEYPSGTYPQGMYYKSGANREINEAVNYCGMLTKIKYPTGGYHELAYEQNEYRLPTNQTHYYPIKQDILASTLLNDANLTIQGTKKTYRIPFTVTSQTGNKWLWIEIEGYNANPQGGLSGDCYTAIETSTGQFTYNPSGFLSLAPGDYYLVARADTAMCSGENPTIKIEYDNDGGQMYSKKTGGVRIKHVRTHDGMSENNDIYKSYVYQDAEGRSSGKLNFLPNYRYISSYLTGENSTSQDSGITTCYDGVLGVMVNISAFTPSVANHLGYSEVQESFGKKTTTIIKGQPVTEIVPNALGKKVYTYTGGSTDPQLVTANPKTESQAPTHQNGMLLSETTFDKQNRKLAETINTYTYETLKDVYGVRIGIQDARFCKCVSSNGTPLQTFIYSVLKETSDWSALIQSVQRNYSFTTGSSTASTYQEIITDYVYNNQTVNNQKTYFLREQKTHNSEGKELKTKYKYAFDYGMTNIYPVYTTPIETIQLKDGKIVGATLTEYETTAFRTVPKKIYAMDLLAPLTPQTGEETGFSGGYTSLPGAYKLKAIFDYDTDLRIKSVKDEQEQEQAFIRASLGTERMVANIAGAALNKTAYMGMEPELVAHNFSVAHGNQEQGAAFSGNYYVKAGATVSSSTMPVGRYLLTFYTKGQGSVNINIGSQSVSGTTSTDWQYQQLELNVTTAGTVIITPASGVALDEIRLHPVGSQMTSRTYYDWGGMRDIVDVKGQKLIYEYDNFYRLKAIRDLDGNIIKTWNYHYKD